MHRRVLAVTAALLILATACADGSEVEPATPSFSQVGTLEEVPPAAPGQLRVEPVGELEGPVNPVAVIGHPGSDSTMLLVDRFGRILELVDGQASDMPWLDLTDRVEHESHQERGLLGLALDDEYAFVYFTDLDGNSQLLAFELDDEGRPLVASERLLLSIDQPGPTHNGGSLQLDGNGYLWVSLGDGHGGYHRWNAQDPTNLLGSILRIDPTPGAPEPYAIPEGNPFVDDPERRPEIYVYGLRNPWSFWFDDLTGDLWIADVGESGYEEISLVGSDEAGGNLGWPWFEGFDQWVDPESHDEPVPEGMIEPLLAYGHSTFGCSVTGGLLLREGPSRLQGAYLFGDFCTGQVFALWPDDAGREVPVERVASASPFLTSINLVGGEIYFTTLGEAGLQRATATIGD